MGRIGGIGGGACALGAACLLLSTLACTPSAHLPAECAAVESPQGLPFTGTRAPGEGPPRLLSLDEEDGLPAFRLHLSGSLPDAEGYQNGWLVHGGRCHAIEVRVRGGTSRKFPKRNFTLKFSPGALVPEGVASAADRREKLVLAASFTDNSYLRQRVAFTLWNRMSPEHVQLNAYSAVVYLDGEYQGLYTALDHVDAELLAAQGYGAGGALFKAVTGSANFSTQSRDGLPKRPLHAGFERKGEGDGAGPPYASIDALTRFVAEAPAEGFAQAAAGRLVLSDYEDWWSFSTLLLATDNATKNACHFLPHGPAGATSPGTSTAPWGRPTRRSGPTLWRCAPTSRRTSSSRGCWRIRRSPRACATGWRSWRGPSCRWRRCWG